jgi:hypothetical protein
VDAHIPVERVHETADFFTRRGAQVNMRIYPGMGNLIVADEFAAARAVLDALIGGAVAPASRQTPQ